MMSASKVPFRPASKYLEMRFAHNSIEITKTDGDLADELWLSLHHAAEVQSVGIELLKTHNSKRVELTDELLLEEWRELRAYLRQAETFYRAAAGLSWISSPLNYYYSFLNLAKASCLLAGVFPEREDVGDSVAEVTPRRVRHGLFEKIVFPDRWTVTVGSVTDVFPLYYELVLKQPIGSKSVLEVHDLLGYSLPIGWQLRKSSYGDKARAFPAYWALVGNGSHSWDLVGLPSGVPSQYIPAAFFDQYDEVEHLSIKDFVRRAFGIAAVTAAGIRFFQRRIPYPSGEGGEFHSGILGTDFRAAMDHHAFPNLSDEIHQFIFSARCPNADGTLSVAMSPEIATYATWFFLSSLVRYHPEYMDKISTSSDAWLIESFVKSAPLDLLRMMTSRILDYSLVMLRV